MHNKMRCNSECLKDLAALALLAALAVGFLWRCNFAGRVLTPADMLLVMEPWKHYARQFPEFQRVSNPMLDAIQQYYPWRKFAGQELRAGRIPLWNPHELCGTPFLANNLSAVLYPETWLHALMPTERALGWSASLSLFTAGSLMYLLLRVLKLVRAACLLGSIAFMFNGFVVAWMSVPPCRAVPGWIPGVLATYELWLRAPQAPDRRRRQRAAAWLAACGLCIGLQFLAGQLHLSLFVLMAFLGYVLFRMWEHRREGDPLGAWRAAAGAIAALTVGGLLAAAQLMPVLELASLSSRSGGLSYPGLLAARLRPAELLTVFMPNLLGNPVDYNHWGAYLAGGYRAFSEAAFYVGVAPLLLAPLAWLRNRREAGFFVLLALLALGIALGTHLNAPLYYLLPGYRSLAGITRAVVLVSLALSALGAMGLHALLTGNPVRRAAAQRVAAWSAVVVAVGGLLAGLWAWMTTGPLEMQLPGLGAYTVRQMGVFGALVVGSGTAVAVLHRAPQVGAAVLLVILGADLYRVTDHLTPAVNPEYLALSPKVIAIMAQSPQPSRILALGRDAIHRMSPNTPMIVGLRDIQGSESLEIGAYRRMLTAASSDRLGFLQPDPSLPLIDLLGVRYVHSAVPLPDPGRLQLVSDEEGYLYENPQALPRAFVVTRAVQATPAQALQKVTAPDFAPREVAYVQAVGGLSAPPAAELEADSCESMASTCRGALRSGQWVVITRAYYPGWRAFQGNRELPVQRADYALCAVRTQSDEARLQMVYWPASFVVGGFLSLFAALVLCAWIAWCRAGGMRP